MESFQMPQTVVSLEELVGLCVALGIEGTGALNPEEIDLISARQSVASCVVSEARTRIECGEDVLGDKFCSIVPPELRRPGGQTYTPGSIIKPMLEWAKRQSPPARIVDPGAGSGRFIFAAAQLFPDAELVACEIDPTSSLMLRATANVLGLSKRLRIVVGDYRTLKLEQIAQPTLFIGNPPYVRHHDISMEWKAWLKKTAARRGLKASALAGLHAHFFLATAEHARVGDYGSFITSSEWLDVNYGQLMRDLFVGALGGISLSILDPESLPFHDAMVTGTISCFKVGSMTLTAQVGQIKATQHLDSLGSGKSVSKSRMAETRRWSTLTRATPTIPQGFVELGELARVHRGAVTGANAVWVTRREIVELPNECLYPSVTRARELFLAGERLQDTSELKVVIDLPRDLDTLEENDRDSVTIFLQQAKDMSADKSYVAANRHSWWSVGLRAPAPILATYMARRPPAFVRNDAKARHINIAHGLYPRLALSDNQLDALATYLRTSVSTNQGRTYAGGLTKFEPKEMERIVVPGPELLLEAGAPWFK